MATLTNSVLAEFDDVLTDLDLGNTGEMILPALAPVAVPELTIVSAPVTPMGEREQFYSDLAKADADELLATADRIRDHASKTLIEIGTALIRIKIMLAGRFDQWLRLEFPLSKSTAWNMINAVERFGDMPKVIEHLPQGAVYKLAAKATPEDVRQSIVRDGADITGTEVERRIQEAKAVERERQKAEREAADEERKQSEQDEWWQNTSLTASQVCGFYRALSLCSMDIAEGCD